MAEMVIETYRTTDTLKEAKKLLHDNDDSPAGRLRIMEKLGLKTLIRTEDSEQRLESARLLWPELLPGDQNEWDFNVWAKFLPTTQQLENYSFDNIPVRVLKEIEDAHDLSVFASPDSSFRADHIEIWTPERNNARGRIATAAWGSARSLVGLVDPMAVGVIRYHSEDHYFAIARWGESLQPFQEIKQHVKRVDRQSAAIRLSWPVGGLLIGLAMVWFALSRGIGSFAGEVDGSQLLLIFGSVGAVFMSVIIIVRIAWQRLYLRADLYHWVRNR